jgi:hypothetical protein
MEHISIPLTQIVEALDVLRRGVGDSGLCDPTAVDQAVSILAGVHEQLGGEARQLLYAVFSASRTGTPPDSLPMAITRLLHHLGWVDSDSASQGVQLQLFKPER